MKFSKKSEYALRALIELTAQYGQPHLQRHEIAKRQQIPIEFLEQILLTLKNAGLLGSRRGVTGGYIKLQAPQTSNPRLGLFKMEGPPSPTWDEQKNAESKTIDMALMEEKSWTVEKTKY